MIFVLYSRTSRSSFSTYAAGKKVDIPAPDPIPSSSTPASPSTAKTTPPSQIESLDDCLTNMLNSGEAESIKLPRNSTLTSFQANEIIEKFSIKNSINTNQAKIIIAILFQAGGTAKSCDGNLEACAFSKTIKLSSLRKTLTDCKTKGSERKLARILADEIARISLVLKIPGNLSRKICSKYPSRIFSIEETVWLSDFQSENLNCPEESRILINAEFAARKPLATNAVESLKNNKNNKK